MLCDELKVYVPQDGPYGLEPVEGGALVEEETCYLKSEVDEAIAELIDKCQMHDFFWEGCGFAKRGFKNTIAVSEAFDRLEAENAELKKKLMSCINGDCILTCEVVEKYGKENAELKAKLEDVQASMYCDVVDANMENRRLKRALWLARANSARNSYLKWNLFANFESEEKLFTIDEYDETPGATDGQVLRTYTEWMKTWNNVERKCREKAEQYK